MNQVINPLRNFPLCLPRTKKEQHEEEIAINLYTILGFRDSKDFEKKVNTFNCSNVKNNAKCIKLRNELFHEFEKQIKQGINENNSAAKNISITAGKSNDVENRLSNILTLNQQAQDFLNGQRKNNITLNAIDSGVVVSGIQLKRPHAKKPKTLTSNKQDFEEVLEYIAQLESKIGITLEELSKCGEHSLKIFLLSHIKQLEYPQLKNKRRDAIRVLASDELRDLYDESVQTGSLLSMPSYQECEELFQKLKNSSEALLSDNQKSTDDIEKKIDELIHHVSLLDKKVGDICKYKETIFCFYGKSQHSNPHKDIYQREVSRAQIKLDQHFNPIQELLKDISQEAENFPEINELKKIINSLHKEHDVLQNKQQISGKINASLICLVNRPLLKSIYD